MLRHRQNKSSENKGMLFIALGLLSFSSIGFYKFFDPPLPKLLLSDIDRVFSVFTNIFFVTALPFFTSAFVKFRSYVAIFRKPELWVNSVFIFFAFLTVLFSVITRNVESESGQNAIIAIDSFFSTITIGLISYAIYKSLTTVWSNLFVKIYFGTFLTIFPLSQILLPITVLYPEQFSQYYFAFLLTLLIGISFFIYASIIYFSILAVKTSDHFNNETIEKPTDFQINSFQLGFDRVKKVYFIEIEFLDNQNNLFKDRVDNRKILTPFSNWILFSLAKKLNVKLIHQDIALTKFRMVEYWNKESEFKLNQEILFTNDLGLFEFTLDANAIEIENMNQLKTKYIIKESLQKHLENFASHFPEKEISKLESNDIFNLLSDKNDVVNS